MGLISRLRLPAFLAFAALAATSNAHGVDTELEIEVTKHVNCTRSTKAGDTIYVHYVGTLASNGVKFDSSRDYGHPFKFTLGAKQVIQGWDDGLVDMCIGELRTLTIPPNLAYGDETMGPIPGGSTLVFDTELMGIEGVEAEPEKPEEALVASPTETASGTAPAALESKPTETEPAKSPFDEPDDGKCHLLGPFALLVQAALGLLAVSSLVWKRWRETPRRPLQVWFFDASKQVVGSVLLHMANLFMSMLSSGTLEVQSSVPSGAVIQAADGGEVDIPNPCSFYLLNLAIDTTIGIPILVILLKILHSLFLRTPVANPPESIRSGNYGHPPRWGWWFKQSIIYFMGLFGMKFCVFILFQLLPWIAWVGDWALRWTEGDPKVQVVFVMFIFPLIMNAMQYYIIDHFIKEHQPADGSDRGEHRPLAQHDDDSDDDEAGGRLSRDSDYSAIENTAQLKEANPTSVPAYDDHRSGSSDGRRRD